MNVAIYVHADAPRERAIAEAMRQGCEVHGDEARVVKLCDYATPDHDLAVLVGRSSGRVFRDYVAAGKPVLIVEKGIFQRKRYERVEIWA